MNLRWYVQPIGNAHGAGLGVPVNGTDSLSASCGRCVHVWMPEDSAKVMFDQTLTGCVGAGLCMPLANKLRKQCLWLIEVLRLASWATVQCVEPKVLSAE